jgi:hypothetical protein
VMTTWPRPPPRDQKSCLTPSGRLRGPCDQC